MNKPLEELVSRNMNYKAVISETEEKEPRFESIIYKWNEEKVSKEGEPLWERVAGPFILDDFKAAKHLAQQQLDLLSGEIIENNVLEEQEITEILGHDNFDFLNIKNFTVSNLKDPESEVFDQIEVQKILSLGELYYVETEQNTWLAGFLYDEGIIRCWKSFDTLKAALLEMNKK